MGMLFELQERLKDKFDLNKTSGRIDQNVVFYTYPFASQFKDSSPSFSRDSQESFDDERACFLSANNPDNRNFRYAVFVPGKRKETAKAVFLLHGLNERRWDKYLLWAYYLAIMVGAPVILFPLANHINRSPDIWSYPRKMIGVVKDRKEHFGIIGNSSFANVALSYRIDRNPEVFISSGVQSVLDIVSLTKDINAGQHPIFSKGTGVDFFSYSIGAMVTELLLMANPFNLYSSSKAFLFCGGATFDQMDARSKSIMDNRAFESLQRFMNQAEVSKVSTRLFEILKPFGSSVKDVFMSMIAMDRLRPERESILRRLSHRIRVVGLNFDKVIPGNAIRQTFCMGDCNNVSVADFDFEYSHEIPFPFADSSVTGKVEQAFRKIFHDASFFLKG
jgi:hypothetical protein